MPPPYQPLPPLKPLSSSVPQEILRPARPWFILLTLALGLIFNQIPLQGLAQALRPDFLALTLLFWCIREPLHIGVVTAFGFGLVMDVADGTLFGQHALAYAILAFGAEYFRRRVLRFPLWQQALQVAVLLVACQGLVLLLRLAGGAAGVPLTYFLSPLTGALLWPPISALLLLPQKPRIKAEQF